MSIISLVPLAVLWVSKGVPFAGFGTLVSVFVLLIGLLAFMLGIISEYVGLIYEESKSRPNYIVSKKVNL